MKDSRQKPKCRLTGEDGNAFAILGRAMEAVKNAGQDHLIKEMMRSAIEGDYNHLLAVVQEYVDDVGAGKNKENNNDE